MRRAILTLLLAAVAQLTFGQFYPERRAVRRGNRAFERENYVEAEGRYDAALERAPASAEAHFGRGDVLYRQGRFEEAEAAFGATLPLTANPEQAAGALYNQSAALVRRYREGYDRQLLDRALEAGKQALRLDPTDEDAKFNLAYIQKLLEQDPDGGGGGGGEDQDQDQDQQQNPEDQPTPNDEQQEGGNDGEPQPASGLSERQIDQVLDALQNNEEQARALMEGEPTEQAVGRSGKNW